MASLVENKAVVRRFIEAMDRQDDAAVAELWAVMGADGTITKPPVLHIPSKGNMAVAFHSTIDDLIAEDDKVVVRLRAHSADPRIPEREARSMSPPTSRGEVRCIYVFRLAEGKIVEDWAGIDPEQFRFLMEKLTEGVKFYQEATIRAQMSTGEEGG
jgi:hypothetical protein